MPQQSPTTNQHVLSSPSFSLLVCFSLDSRDLQTLILTVFASSLVAFAQKQSPGVSRLPFVGNVMQNTHALHVNQ